MTEAEQPAIQMTTASRTFKGHGDEVLAASVKIGEGHHFCIGRVAVSRDGQFIASGDDGGELIAWNRDGESLIQPTPDRYIWSFDFAPDSTLLASGSHDATTASAPWNIKTWQVQGDLINCGTGAEVTIRCVLNPKFFY